MGLLDSALGMLGGGQQAAQGTQGRLLQAALSLLADTGQGGGLQGLHQRFQEAGLDHLIGSWIGTGENLPISPEQIRQVMGDGQLEQVSEETGMTENETAAHLSDMLPGLVDRITPNGSVPEGGLGDVGTLMAKVLGHGS